MMVPDRGTLMPKRPVAVCTQCGAYIENPAAIDFRCDRKHAEKRCDGVLRDAIEDHEWERCAFCAGTGRAGDRPCVECQGSGWAYIGD